MTAINTTNSIIFHWRSQSELRLVEWRWWAALVSVGLAFFSDAFTLLLRLIPAHRVLIHQSVCFFTVISPLNGTAKESNKKKMICSLIIHLVWDCNSKTRFRIKCYAFVFHKAALTCPRAISAVRGPCSTNFSRVYARHLASDDIFETDLWRRSVDAPQAARRRVLYIGPQPAVIGIRGPGHSCLALRGSRTKVTEMKVDPKRNAA